MSGTCRQQCHMVRTLQAQMLHSLAPMDKTLFQSFWISNSHASYMQLFALCLMQNELHGKQCLRQMDVAQEMPPGTDVYWGYDSAFRLKSSMNCEHQRGAENYDDHDSDLD